MQQNEPGERGELLAVTQADIDVAEWIVSFTRGHKVTFANPVEHQATQRIAAHRRASQREAPAVEDEREAVLLNSTEIKRLWKKHGGSQHGPMVETYTIEEQAFYRFAQELTALSRPSTPVAGEVERLREALREIEYRSTNHGGWFDQDHFGEYCKLGDIARTALADGGENVAG